MGTRRRALEELGYTYVNLDLKPHGERKVQGDAHQMPFVDDSFSVVVCSDAFDSLPDQQRALAEIKRVSSPEATFIFWAPFFHQFAGDDLFRYTPVGIEALLDRAGFQIESVEAPQWLFGLLAEVPDMALRRWHLSRLERPIEWIGDRLDGLVQGDPTKHLSLARAYIVVARPGAAAGGAENRTARLSLRRPRAGRSMPLRKRLLLDAVTRGRGNALLLTDDRAVEASVRKLGYSPVVGRPPDPAAHDDVLPFDTASFSLVVSANGLGDFPDPFKGISEIRRVLRNDGRFIAWAPYLHPWTGDEYMRFTPLGLDVSLRWAGFRVTSFETELRLFSVLAQVLIHGLRRPPGGWLAKIAERMGYAIDRGLRRFLGLGYTFAAGFILVAIPDEPSAPDLLQARKVPVEMLWEELGDLDAAADYRKDRLAKEAAERS